MASFAKIENNIVIAVHSVSNQVLKDSNGIEQEAIGIQFLKTLYNEPNSVWKQTSYNGNIRKNYAGIGFTYDEQRNAFIPLKLYNSWILNEETCLWEPPISKPTEQLEENQYYSWNEDIINWEVITRQ